jgi:AcrR family transcriptional regulator
MSRKSAAASPRKTDRRVLRTRDALGDALISLIREKPFDEITVQHVLDRAKVGRSTFYTHFVGKEDLFLSDMEDFFKWMAGYLSRSAEKSNRVAPVRELFAHVAEQRQLLAALVASGRIHDVLQLAQGNFANGIEQRLAVLPQARAIGPVARAAMAQSLAGAMLSLMLWWLDRGTSASPEQMDAVFHHLVWSGIAVAGTQLPSARETPRKNRAPAARHAIS